MCPGRGRAPHVDGPCLGDRGGRLTEVYEIGHLKFTLGFSPPVICNSLSLGIRKCSLSLTMSTKI